MDQTNNDSSKVEKVMDSHGSTALFLAIASGSLNDVKCLHEAGADMSCKNEEGDTLLNRAVTLGFIDIVAYLLKNAKLDPNLKGMCGRMAIQNAIEICNIDILTLLIDHGAKWHESFIIQLARSGNADIIDKIMERYYVKLNYRHTDGKSALMVRMEAITSSARRSITQARGKASRTIRAVGGAAIISQKALKKRVRKAWARSVPPRHPTRHRNKSETTPQR